MQDVDRYERNLVRWRSLAKKVLIGLAIGYAVLHIGMSLYYRYAATRDRATRVSVHEFAADLRAGRIEEIEIRPGDAHDEYRYIERKVEGRRERRAVVGAVDRELQLEIQRKAIRVRRAE